MAVCLQGCNPSMLTVCTQLPEELDMAYIQKQLELMEVRRAAAAHHPQPTCGLPAAPAHPLPHLCRRRKNVGATCGYTYPHSQL